MGGIVAALERAVRQRRQARPCVHSLLPMPMQDILGVLSLRIDVAMALQQRSGALG
jgi:hypothetical protein